MTDENRRIGNGRIDQEGFSDAEKQLQKERRELVKDSERLIEFMKKIPIFKGFQDEQYLKLLSICSKDNVPMDQYLCKEGDESKTIYILIKGKLRIVTGGNIFLAYITPLGSVGEIGVFTGSKRSASVVADSDCNVIKITKNELFALCNSDSKLSNRLFLNVIADLANKLKEDNEFIENIRNRKLTRIL